MEKRFTFKDFFLFSFLGLLFVTLLLSMYMVDRQWAEMAKMQSVMQEQAEDIRSLRGLLGGLDQRIRDGSVLASAGNTAAAEDAVPAAFQRSHAAAQIPGYQRGDWLVNAFGTGLKKLDSAGRLVAAT